MNEITKKVMAMDPEERSGIFKRIFSGIDGKLLLEDLKIRCSEYDSMAKPDPQGPVVDPYTLYFTEGQRSVVKYIESMIEYEPQEKSDAVTT